MLDRIGLSLCALALATATVWAQPRVWIADQGDNHGYHNRILEIDPVNHGSFEDSDVNVLNVLPSPAGAFLDELTFDDNDRLWCVVKEESDQHPDGARRIDKEIGLIDIPPGLISIDFPGETYGGYLEGLAWDGVGLWATAVRDGLSGNMLTRVDPATGDPIAPFDSGPAFVNIPGNIAQGLLYDPEGTGYLWHSDVGQRKIYKLDVNNNFAVVKTFHVPAFPPKGMDFMGQMIWVAAPNHGIWEIDPAAPDGSDGNAVRKFSTPTWNLDGIAILDQPPGPEIVLSTATIDRSAWIFNDLGNDAFTVANGGDGTLSYQIDDDDSAPWLSVAPASGTATDEADPITVSYDVDELRAGVYPATIEVTGNAYNSPQTIAVTVTIETVGPDLDGDCDVDQEDFGWFQRCLTGAGVTQDDPECWFADFDHDNDVDGDDFGRFQRCHTGANICADPDCEAGGPES